MLPAMLMLLKLLAVVAIFENRISLVLVLGMINCPAVVPPRPLPAMTKYLLDLVAVLDMVVEVGLMPPATLIVYVPLELTEIVALSPSVYRLSFPPVQF